MIGPQAHTSSTLLRRAANRPSTIACLADAMSASVQATLCRCVRAKDKVYKLGIDVYDVLNEIQDKYNV